MFSRQVAEAFDVKLNVDKVIEDAEDELDSLPDEDDWLEILDFIEDNIVPKFDNLSVSKNGVLLVRERDIKKYFFLQNENSLFLIHFLYSFTSNPFLFNQNFNFVF